MKGSTVIKGIALLLGVVFVINQLVSSLYSPVKTESADFYTATDGFNIEGFVIRKETPVISEQDGVMHYVVSDGSRVSKDGVIANIYKSKQDSIDATEAQVISQKIADLEAVLGYNAIEATNLELLNTNVKESVNRLIYSASAGNFDGILMDSEELLSAINHRQGAMGMSEGFEAQLAQLKAQLNGVEPVPNASVKAEQSGYFVSSTDGYEETFKETELSEITPEFLSSAKPKKKDKEVIGKIVSDYEWYIAANVSINESLSYKEGEGVILLTSLKSAPSLAATVKKINLSKNSSSAVIIFSCNEMSSELAQVRVDPMTVVKKQYEGLKISKKALRVVDSVRGVYVVSGMQMNFVPVKIIYFGEDFLICEKETDNDRRVLKLYDNVIVKGKNLYDGKIIG